MAFRRPSTANLQSQNHQTCPSFRANQFGGKSAPCLFLPLTAPLRLVSRLLAWCFRHLAVLTPKCCRLQNGRFPRVAVRLQQPPDVLHLLPTGTAKSMLRTTMFGTTLAPPSLQMRAAMLSSGNPLLPNTPVRPQAARWWPKESAGRPHPQMRLDSDKGRNAAPAPWPLCDLNNA